MNRGLDLRREEQDRRTTDYLFGAASPECIARIPLTAREKNLPVGEVQRGVEDFMDCASRGPINDLETKFTFLYQHGILSGPNMAWLLDNGYADAEGRITFSDRFIAIRSGTNRQGNSLKAPCQAIHTYGLLPKKKLPASKSMTFSEYHRKRDITLSMDMLAYQFASRFPIGYDIVFDHQRDIADDMRVVAGHAWPRPVNGVYPRVESPINHVFLDFADPQFTIFDNYLDTDGDFVKRLAPNYALLGYGYRLYVAENRNVKTQSAIDLIISLFLKGKTKQALALTTKTFGSWLGLAS
jgi:hypothetical protein